jgi:hypothetical protein
MHTDVREPLERGGVDARILKLLRCLEGVIVRGGAGMIGRLGEGPLNRCSPILGWLSGLSGLSGRTCGDFFAALQPRPGLHADDKLWAMGGWLRNPSLLASAVEDPKARPR